MITYKEFEPKIGTEFSAGIDLAVAETVEVEPGAFRLIGLDARWDFKTLEAQLYKSGDTPQKLANRYEKFKRQHFGGLFLRSSMSESFIIANGIGVIDFDYPKNFKIAVVNHTKKNVRVEKGFYIAQLIVMEHRNKLFNLQTSIKRVDGFGSTN